ncbi:MAG TPA: hypothetical protein VFP84_19845 [Kofleriaceae bacterium]|nr:hypothetical protein [Kofleriaceae bacterium]
MRIALFAVLVVWLASGCIEEHPSAPSHPHPPVTVHITMAAPPALVVVRDGPSGAWAPAKPLTATTFEATVSHAYLVTVVCHQESKVAFGAYHEDAWQTWQIGRSPDEPSELTAPCAPAPAVSQVTGTMVQAGQAQLGEFVVSSATPSWQFTAFPVAGERDLIASSADHVQIVRDLPIAMLDNNEPLPAIDVEANGTPLTAVRATSDAAAGETVTAAVYVTTATTTAGAAIASGALDRVLVVPDGVLVDGDTQDIAVSATAGTARRALRRPYHAGDDLAFALPDPLVATWHPTADEVAAAAPTADTALSVTWSILPARDHFVAHVDGVASDPGSPGRAAVYDLDLSDDFLAVGVTHRVTIDTAIPGFDPAWKLDLRQAYTRTVRVVRDDGDAHATSEIREAVAAYTPPAPTT